MEVSKDTWAYWYDLINTKERNDKQFYLDLVDDKNALELACGTGRIYLDMLENGYNVDGLDISKDMLTRLRNKAKDRQLTKNLDRNNLYNNSIENMDFDKQYDIIYYPFNSIAHITGSVQEKLNAFKNIKDHLKENGKFAFDIYVLDHNVVDDYQKIESMNFSHNETEYRFETWTEFASRTEQIIKSKNRIINLHTNKIEWDKYHKLSLYPKPQLELLLDQAGFSEYTFNHEFTDKKVNDNSDTMSIIAYN